MKMNTQRGRKSGAIVEVILNEGDGAWTLDCVHPGCIRLCVDRKAFNATSLRFNSRLGESQSTTFEGG